MYTMNGDELCSSCSRPFYCRGEFNQDDACDCVRIACERCGHDFVPEVAGDVVCYDCPNDEEDMDLQTRINENRDSIISLAAEGYEYEAKTLARALFTITCTADVTMKPFDVEGMREANAKWFDPDSSFYDVLRLINDETSEDRPTEPCRPLDAPMANDASFDVFKEAQ